MISKSSRQFKTSVPPLRFLLAAVIFAVAGMHVHAAQRILLDSVCYEARGACVHVRTDLRDWALTWDYADTDNYMTARVHRSSPYTDDIAPCSSEITIVRVADGMESIILKTTVSHRHDYFSLYLQSDSYGTRMKAGDGTAVKCDSLKMSLANGSLIFTETPKSFNNKTVLNCSVDYYSPAQPSTFATVTDLEKYLATSTDPMEGFWKYLDRDFIGNVAVTGGRYHMAMVRADIALPAGNRYAVDNAYVLLYLDGALSHTELWKSLQVKAYLMPTAFIGSYDMVWLGADRSEVGALYEANASFSPNLLTLNFPIAKASMRMERVR